MLNEYEIECLNTTNNPIANMQNFIYWLYTSSLDCFCHLISPLCIYQSSVIIYTVCPYKESPPSDNFLHKQPDEMKTYDVGVWLGLKGIGVNLKQLLRVPNS